MSIENLEISVTTRHPTTSARQNKKSQEYKKAKMEAKRKKLQDLAKIKQRLIQPPVTKAEVIPEAEPVESVEEVQEIVQEPVQEPIIIPTVNPVEPEPEEKPLDIVQLAMQKELETEANLEKVISPAPEVFPTEDLEANSGVSIIENDIIEENIPEEDIVQESDQVQEISDQVSDQVQEISDQVQSTESTGVSLVESMLDEDEEDYVDDFYDTLEPDVEEESVKDFINALKVTNNV